MKLRRGATEFVPAAGVDDEQAAVGIFKHVGRVEIEVGAGDEVFVARSLNVDPEGERTWRLTLCRLK